MADKRYTVTAKGLQFARTIGVVSDGNKRVAKWIVLAIQRIEKGQSKGARTSTKKGIRNEINIRPESFETGWKIAISQKYIR